MQPFTKMLESCHLVSQQSFVKRIVLFMGSPILWNKVADHIVKARDTLVATLKLSDLDSGGGGGGRGGGWVLLWKH